MEYDSSDILGHPTMPTTKGKRQGGFSFGRAVFLGIALLAIYLLANWTWKRYKRYREQGYKLATRRRHGIPDSDLRPFNVAYSDAMAKAREEEVQRQQRPKPSPRPQVIQVGQRAAQLEQSLRHRSGVAQSDLGSRNSTIPIPGGYSSGSYLPPFPSRTSLADSDPRTLQGVVDRHNHRLPIGQPALPSYNGVSREGLARHGGYTNIDEADTASDNEGKKRGPDEDQDQEHEAKKSRVEGDELIDGDEDAQFEDLAPKRGSKRSIREEDTEEVAGNRKTRGKRARKFSQEKKRQVDHSMDVDDDEEEDEITELKSTNRGKKRDRAEAGSTFGGDDDESASEIEEGDAKARRRRRKRRTVAKRKSEASYLRGKKRDRDGEGEVSDHESGESSLDAKVSRNKRGRRSSHLEQQSSKSDISMGESTTSSKGKIRKIGDEWESNGIKYKIGPNYQRLRQALVRKARQKFVMPQDSQHPDREANHQIYVETWLTEEEYQDAKSKQLLAWQEPTPRSSEAPERLFLNISQDTVPFPRSSAGKNLLWSTSTSSTSTTMSPGLEGPPDSVKHKGYRHSIATSVGLPVNPFATSQIPTAKRIASTTRVNSLVSSTSGSPGLSDSTNGSPRTPHKVFSKWEKQELEAKAMMKMREANRKKELEKEAKLKEEKERVERAAAEKLRLERERLEKDKKEQAERERQQRAAAEAERKAKEATQNIPVPSITVTPPSQPASGTPSFFNLNSSNSSEPSAPSFPAPKADNPPSAQPSFFSKPAEQNPSSSSQPTGSAQPSTLPSNFFNSSSAPAAGKPNGFFTLNPEPKKDSAEGGANAGGSLLSRMGPLANPEPSKTTSSQPAAKPMFSFNQPDQTVPTNIPNSFAAPQVTSTTTAPSSSTPKFSFSGFSNKSTASSSVSAANGMKVPTSAFPTSTSTLSGALGSDQKASSQSAPLAFGFKQPTTPASAANANNSNTTSTPTTTPAESTSTSTTAVPKFNFSGFSNTSNQNKEPAKSSFPTTTTVSPFGNNTTTTSPFGNTTTSSPFGNASNQNKDPVKFPATAAPSSFGSSSSSPFGNNTAPLAFGGNTNSQSPFSNNSGAGPSPFGATAAQTQSVFGGGSNAGASKPMETPKPAFGFGTAPSAAPTSSSTTTPAGAPLKFSFGNANAQTPPAAPAPAASTTTPAAAPKFNFNFAPQPPGSTTPKSPFSQ